MSGVAERESEHSSRSVSSSRELEFLEPRREKDAVRTSCARTHESHSQSAARAGDECALLRAWEGLCTLPTTVGLLAALSEASAECFFSDGSVGVRLLRRMKEDDRASIMGRFEWQPTAFEPTAATYEVEADTRGMLLLWSFQTHIETVTATRPCDVSAG